MRLFALIALVFAVGCDACTSPPPRADAGEDASIDGAIADAGPDVVKEAAEAAPCVPPPRPAYVPAGWIPYDDYAPCSGLYIPSDPSQLPSPIAWQDCEPLAGVTGCRRIKVDWSPLPNSDVYVPADVAIDSNGKTLVLTSRDFGDTTGAFDHRLAIVAEADGPVRVAILSTRVHAFFTNSNIPPTFSPPRWIFGVTENFAFDSGGYVAGTIDALTPTTHGRIDGGSPWYGVGVLGVLEDNILLDFDSGATVQVINGSLPMSFEWMFNGYVFWQGNSGHVADVGRWDPDGGSIDFINYGFDPQHAAADFGTDGTDMVWLEGHGPSNDAGAFYTSADYWTAPYVKDKSLIAPRRLCSEVPNSLLGTPIAVGCGMAAYASAAYGMRIIRLSDGWSWFLPTNPSGWQWNQALALTCTELFASVAISGPMTTLARLPLANLGAGVAPD